MNVLSWIFCLPEWLQRQIEDEGFTDGVRQEVQAAYKRGEFSKKQYREICNHFRGEVEPNLRKEVKGENPEWLGYWEE